jgi:hypothetical protein
VCCIDRSVYGVVLDAPMLQGLLPCRARLTSCAFFDVMQLRMLLTFSFTVCSTAHVDCCIHNVRHRTRIGKIAV